jgi:hypothetical protein
MQMHGGIAGAAALGRDDFDQVTNGRRVDRPQKNELTVRDHDIFPSLHQHNYNSTDL